MSDAIGPNLTLRDLFRLGRRLSDTGDNAPAPPLDDLVSVEVKDAAIEPDVLLDGVLSQLGSLLDVEIAEIIATAWSKAQQLQEYRDPERHPPAELSTVSLVEHTVESRYEPAIELLVNGKSVQHLGVSIALELAIQALALEIQGGRITAIRPGRCQASGRIHLQRYPLAELETQQVELPGRKTFDEGIAIPDLTGSDASETDAEATSAVSPVGRREAHRADP